MNFADSERLAAFLKARGLKEVPSPEQADIIIVNSCSVRKHAEDRMFGYLSSLKGLKKSGKIFCLYGCTANLYGEKVREQYPFIDVICGPNRFSESLNAFQSASRGEPAVLVGESDQPFLREVATPVEGISASISVTKGCENYCSYCVVPFARGKLMSRTPQEILAEIKELAEKGMKEISLLGQNVNEYGKDLANTDFVSLLEQVHQTEGISRIRFLTSHPKDVPESLITAFRDLPKLYKHLHLPLQSGSNRILQAMNRKYTLRDYLNIVEKARSTVPEISITSDIMVGFPGEGEADFEVTRKVVEDVQFDELFVFKYSPRPGTRACSLPDTVPQKEKESRHQTILKLQGKISQALNQKCIGRTEEILVGKASYKKKGYLVGRTITDKPVLFEGAASLLGRLVQVQIISANSGFLLAGICCEKGRLRKGLTHPRGKPTGSYPQKSLRVPDSQG